MNEGAMNEGVRLEPIWWFVLILLLTPLTGCGEANPLGRQGLSGEVRFAGELLDQGTIEFSPVDPNGVSSGTIIQQGKYEIPAHQGVPAGAYKVRIMSPEDKEEEPEEPSAPPGPEAMAQGPRQPPPAQERIPAEYNTKTKVLIEVTTKGPQKFDFDIQANGLTR